MFEWWFITLHLGSWHQLPHQHSQHLTGQLKGSPRTRGHLIQWKDGVEWVMMDDACTAYVKGHHALSSVPIMLSELHECTHHDTSCPSDRKHHST
jgi:hypothetical protein